ncbi:uncharacterized protein EDB91DRAFT_1337310 [Suillus paluster]|uniref:uncharacterized protein n=1 Tax=Suillus paluster TaxID=48578 RepID=UPI001B86FEE2|nr:uncharacterized protein EDB91DRAFT_1337310 [Suillus paluster]KAG1737130.1 hypothetical protein EDB91DRAFT_1337310 [Suillus paluster]
MTRAFELIQDWVGMHGLARKDCFNPKGRSVPPEWFVRHINPDDGPEDIETVHIWSGIHRVDGQRAENIGVETVRVLVVCLDEEDVQERLTQEKTDFMSVDEKVRNGRTVLDGTTLRAT